jgi:N-acetylneuraminic acid mutarotase
MFMNVCASFHHSLLRLLLVVAVACCGASANAAELAPSASTAAAASAKLPPLPEKISSFGAAVVGDDLYVYSGHTGGAHQHSKENLSYKFSRLKLAAPSEWEALPVGPGLQSPALVAHGGKVYRAGGLTAHNAPKEEEQLESLADFERYDPKTNKWTKLAPLPEPRSSHDAVVVGDKLYVIGGWNLGKDEKKWHDTAIVADLSQAKPEWKELPKQPFKRRALGVAEVGGKLYAIGGMTEDGPSLDVAVLDLASGKWSEGPKVPVAAADGESMGPGLNGFGCSAFGVDGKLYLSTMDGTVHQLSADGKSWQGVAKLEQPRFFHRLLPHDGELIVLGGASMKKGHLDSIERIVVEGASR